MEQIRKYFNQLLPLSDEEWNAYAGCLSKRHISRNQHLLEAGKTCDFIAFIEQGSFRFYFTQKGTEIVTAFFFTGDFLSNYRSFVTQSPSTHHIQSLSESVIWVIKREQQMILYDKYPKFERLGRVIAENLYLSVARRLDSFLYETPEERYRDLFLRGSRLLQDVPQYMLASYLGISPESLSRIRKRISA
jgi:CRP-like cAMP-binding protein